jgi:hypothetical protein
MLMEHEGWTRAEARISPLSMVTRKSRLSKHACALGV